MEFRRGKSVERSPAQPCRQIPRSFLTYPWALVLWAGRLLVRRREGAKRVQPLGRIREGRL